MPSDRAELTPAVRFNRSCAAVGLLYLMVSISANMAWHTYHGLPQAADFPQYYMGGLIAKAGAWDALYPQPKPGSAINPGNPEGSALRPRYAQLAGEAGVQLDTFRFIQPPPLALLLMPLALLPFKISYVIWTVLLILATWGIGLQAGRIYTVASGREDRLAGGVTLLLCVSPIAYRWVRSANMSVVIGWLIGYVALALVQRKEIGGAIALVTGAIAKYAVVVLLPLHVLLGQWRSLLWAAGIAGSALVVSLLVMGSEPYRVFLREIAPTLGRTNLYAQNQALYAFLMRASGANDEEGLPHRLELLFQCLRVVSLATILGMLVLRRRQIRAQPQYTIAAALALMSWLLTFSPIFWEHYHAYLGPFWGWLLANALLSRLRAIGAAASIGLTLVPWSIIAQHLNWPQLPEPLFSHLLWATVLMGILAVWAIASAEAKDINEKTAID